MVGGPFYRLLRVLLPLFSGPPAWLPVLGPRPAFLLLVPGSPLAHHLGPRFLLGSGVPRSPGSGPSAPQPGPCSRVASPPFPGFPGRPAARAPRPPRGPPVRWGAFPQPRVSPLSLRLQHLTHPEAAGGVPAADPEERALLGLPGRPAAGPAARPAHVVARVSELLLEDGQSQPFVLGDGFEQQQGQFEHGARAPSRRCPKASFLRLLGFNFSALGPAGRLRHQNHGPAPGSAAPPALGPALQAGTQARAGQPRHRGAGLEVQV